MLRSNAWRSNRLFCSDFKPAAFPTPSRPPSAQAATAASPHPTTWARSPPSSPVRARRCLVSLRRRFRRKTGRPIVRRCRPRPASTIFPRACPDRWVARQPISGAADPLHSTRSPRTTGPETPSKCAPIRPCAAEDRPRGPAIPADLTCSRRGHRACGLRCPLRRLRRRRRRLVCPAACPSYDSDPDNLPAARRRHRRGPVSRARSGCDRGQNTSKDKARRAAARGRPDASTFKDKAPGPVPVQALPPEEVSAPGLVAPRFLGRTQAPVPEVPAQAASRGVRSARESERRGSRPRRRTPP